PATTRGPGSRRRAGTRPRPRRAPRPTTAGIRSSPSRRARRLDDAAANPALRLPCELRELAQAVLVEPGRAPRSGIAHRPGIAPRTGLVRRPGLHGGLARLRDLVEQVDGLLRPAHEVAGTDPRPFEHDLDRRA